MNQAKQAMVLHDHRCGPHAGLREHNSDSDSSEKHETLTENKSGDLGNSPRDGPRAARSGGRDIVWHTGVSCPQEAVRQAPSEQRVDRRHDRHGRARSADDARSGDLLHHGSLSQLPGDARATRRVAQVAASATCVPTAQEVAGNVALDSSASSGFATPVGSKPPTGATLRPPRRSLNLERNVLNPHLE